MRTVIAGSFVGFVCAAAFFAACGSGGSGGNGINQATIDELELRIAGLEQQLDDHATDTRAHPGPVHTLGLRYVISLSGAFPSRSLELPGDPGTELSSAPLLGGVGLFAGAFAPRGWAFCEGQLLPISENESLYSILGTTYGGDGRVDFALPDLRSRAVLGVGARSGLDPVDLGQEGP